MMKRYKIWYHSTNFLSFVIIKARSKGLAKKKFRRDYKNKISVINELRGSDE